MTRSKKASTSTTWVQIPLPVKLTKVLIGELKSQLEEEEDDDDGPWEDVDEEVLLYLCFRIFHGQ